MIVEDLWDLGAGAAVGTAAAIEAKRIQTNTPDGVPWGTPSGDGHRTATDCTNRLSGGSPRR
jgi:hypothetical protein